MPPSSQPAWMSTATRWSRAHPAARSRDGATHPIADVWMRGPCHLAHPLAIDPHPRGHAQRAEFEDPILVLESGNPAGRSNHRRHQDWPAESFRASAKKWMGRGTGTSPDAGPTESGFHQPAARPSFLRSPMPRQPIRDGVFNGRSEVMHESRQQP